MSGAYWRCFLCSATGMGDATQFDHHYRTQHQQHATIRSPQAPTPTPADSHPDTSTTTQTGT